MYMDDVDNATVYCMAVCIDDVMAQVWRPICSGTGIGRQCTALLKWCGFPWKDTPATHVVTSTAER